MHQKQIIDVVDKHTPSILAGVQGLQRGVLRRKLQAMRTDLLDLAITEDAPMDYCLGCGDVIATESGAESLSLEGEVMKWIEVKVKVPAGTFGDDETLDGAALQIIDTVKAMGYREKCLQFEAENNRRGDALKRIANEDYRGNRCSCSMIADEALKGGE